MPDFFFFPELCLKLKSKISYILRIFDFYDFAFYFVKEFIGWDVSAKHTWSFSKEKEI